MEAGPHDSKIAGPGGDGARAEAELGHVPRPNWDTCRGPDWCIGDAAATRWLAHAIRV